MGVLVLCAVGLTACSNSSSPTSTSPTDSITTVDQTVGTGAVAAAGHQVSVTYTGTLTNGTVFDSTAAHGGTPFTFVLGQNQVVPGFDQGVTGMKVGGTRQVTIPPDLGYGAAGSPPSIPANATLIFTITLVSVI